MQTNLKLQHKSIKRTTIKRKFILCRTFFSIYFESRINYSRVRNT